MTHRRRGAVAGKDGARGAGDPEPAEPALVPIPARVLEWYLDTGRVVGCIRVHEPLLGISGGYLWPLEPSEDALGQAYLRWFPFAR